jgi:hypothetical protein
MAYEDLPLGRSSATPPLPDPPRRHSASRAIVAVAAVIVVAGGLYFWWINRQPAIPVAPTPTAATDVNVPSMRPPRQPIELPALDDSDSLVRQFVSMLSQHPQLARWLATKGLVRNVVLTVEQVGDGRTPEKPLSVLAPPSHVIIMGTESGRIAPAAYVRWESDVAALTSVRPAEAAQLYVNVKPLFDAAYADLGHVGGDFDESLTRAIAMLLATPEPADEPLLLKRSGFYEHSDATLRALKPVQKQFLLLGPERRARVRAWLTDLAAALDLKLPAAG